MGKGKKAVLIIRKYLKQGRRVATNMDINLDQLMLPHSKKTLIRIPDKPSVADLFAAGHGNPDSYDETMNGALVLDELGTWLNARNFADKNRQHIIDFLVHTRKLGWDVYFTCQSFNAVDKQVRESVVDHIYRCVRFDKWRIPFVGPIIQIFNEDWGYLPRFHMCTTHMVVEGSIQPGTIDREFYIGDYLHAAYDTRQIFTSDYPHGVHSVLSAWHVKGRHRKPDKPTFFSRLFAGDRKSAYGAKPMLPSVALVAKLPPAQRIRHVRRLIASGAV